MVGLNNISKVKVAGAIFGFKFSIPPNMYIIHSFDIQTMIYENKMPRTPEGMQATATLNHIEKISFLIMDFVLSVKLKGNILFQKILIQWMQL